MDIRFAGIGFVGNAADASERLPVLSEILSKDRLTELNQMLYQMVQAANPTGLRITADLGDSRSGSAIAMALALENEQLVLNRFSSEIDGSGGKSAIFAQLLVFDLGQSRLLTIVPLYAQKANFHAGTWDPAVGRAWIEDLLYRDPSENIFAKFVEVLRNLQVNQTWGANIQVKSVNLGEHALGEIQRYQIKPDEYKRWLAAVFGAELSAALRVPVLPYSAGQAIASAIPLRFSNADAVNFSLPPADFEIDLTARGYAQKETGFSERTRNLSHVAAFGVKIRDAAFSKEYLNMPFQIVRAEVYNKDTEVNNWVIYEELSTVIIKDFVRQIESPRSEWLKKHVVHRRVGESKKQLETVNEYIVEEIRGL